MRCFPADAQRLLPPTAFEMCCCLQTPVGFQWSLWAANVAGFLKHQAMGVFSLSKSSPVLSGISGCIAMAYAWCCEMFLGSDDELPKQPMHLEMMCR